MLGFILFSLGCDTPQPAQSWMELPASTYCSDAEPEKRDACRVEECASVVKAVGAPSTADATALTALCEMAEASNSEGAQFCGVQSCFYLPQVDLSEGMRMLNSSLPVSANQKRTRAAILRGVLEKDELLSLALEGAKGNPLKNTAWYALAVAEIDCEMAGISKDLSMPCPEVSPQNVQLMLALSEELRNSSSEYHTLLNMASAADFSVSAEALTAIVADEQRSDAEKKAAVGAIQVALMRGDRLPRSLVNTWVDLCDPPTASLRGLCEQLLR